MAILSPAQQRMIGVLERYDREGAEDDANEPNYFDTTQPGAQRTLWALARKGLVHVWIDPTNRRRVFAALPPKD